MKIFDGSLSEELTRLDRGKFTDSLKENGFDEQKIRELTRDSGRSISVIRRRLVEQVTGYRPGWAQKDRAQEFMASMLLGQWSDDNKEDQAVVSKIADLSYKEFSGILLEFLIQEDAPIRKIGDRWRLTSHEEAWDLIGSFLTDDTLNRFAEVAGDVLAVTSTAYELPSGQRWLAGIHGKGVPHSRVLRQGVTRTLALMGGRSKTTPIIGQTQDVVDKIVGGLFSKEDDWRFWASIDHLLPDLIEASPEIILGKIEGTLSWHTSTFEGLLGDDGGLFDGCNHSGLLWCLERAAWSDQYFARVVHILARLSEIDPGGTWNNRPENSLHELFLPWLRFSEASDTSRLSVLDQTIARFPQIGWKLLVGLAPGGGSSVIVRHPPEWRDWGRGVSRPTNGEIVAYMKGLSLRLKAGVSTLPGRWTDCVGIIDKFDPSEQDEWIGMLLSASSEIRKADTSFSVWEKLRAEISQHRSFPDTDWAMKEKQLAQLESIYHSFEPTDPIRAGEWLFEHWPDIIEGKERIYDDKVHQIQKARSEVIVDHIGKYGKEAVFDFATSNEKAHQVGLSLIDCCNFDEKIINIITNALREKDQPSYIAALGAVARVNQKYGDDGISKVIVKVRADNMSKDRIAEILLCRNANQNTWSDVENEDADVQRLYWINPRLPHRVDGDSDTDLGYATKKFLLYDAPISALFLLDHAKGKVESDLIVQTLKALPGPLVKAIGDNARVDLPAYRLTRLFEKLDEAGDVPNEEIAKLEVPFVALLRSEKRQLALHREIARDASTFVELVTWAYKSKKEADDGTSDRKTDDQDQKNAKFAHRILDKLDTVPGYDRDTNKIDQAKLDRWILEARGLCAQRDRVEISDILIGQILANAPIGDDSIWPCEQVRNVLERDLSEELVRGFIIGKHNLRGVTTRSPFEGGEQERGLADGLRKDAMAVQSQYPATAKILRSLAKSYEDDAKRHDDDAEWTDHNET